MGAAVDILSEGFARMDGLLVELLLKPSAVVAVAEEVSVPLCDGQMRQAG